MQIRNALADGRSLRRPSACETRQIPACASHGLITTLTPRCRSSPSKRLEIRLSVHTDVEPSPTVDGGCRDKASRGAPHGRNRRRRLIALSTHVERCRMCIARGPGRAQTAGSYRISAERNMSTTRNVRLWPLAALAVTIMSGLPATARDADLASHTVAAAPTAKQQCISICRARYRDCRRLNQLPSFECRGVYQDCTRYSCAGLGPG